MIPQAETTAREPRPQPATTGFARLICLRRRTSCSIPIRAMSTIALPSPSSLPIVCRCRSTEPHRALDWFSWWSADGSGACRSLRCSAVRSMRPARLLSRTHARASSDSIDSSDRRRDWRSIGTPCHCLCLCLCLGAPQRTALTVRPARRSAESMDWKGTTRGQSEHTTAAHARASSTLAPHRTARRRSATEKQQKRAAGRDSSAAKLHTLLAASVFIRSHTSHCQHVHSFAFKLWPGLN